MNNLKPITILVFGLFSLATLGESKIVEFKSDYFPVKFKYNPDEYGLVVPRFPKRETFVLLPKVKEKKESIFADKKYNKNFYSRMEIGFTIDPSMKQKSAENLTAKVKREEVLSWTADINFSGLDKTLNDMKAPIIKNGIVEQTFEKIYCGRWEHSNGSDSKEFVYEGEYGIRRSVFDLKRGVSFRVSISDPIDSYEGASDCNSGNCHYISSSPFFEKHYCEDNEALKNWDIGNYGRLVMNSVEINEDYFKPEALKKREEAIKKHEAKIAYDKTPEAFKEGYEKSKIRYKALFFKRQECDKRKKIEKKISEDCFEADDEWFGEGKSSGYREYIVPWDTQEMQEKIRKEVVEEIEKEAAKNNKK